ncbi:hypothetical protein V1512DRAFT_240823 [Lipomyces arxii]|uniref:uncharacterized protein n=1 Tax=Lipomyces arxii TaxID=56418 RepID=UPI0034CEEB24
MSTPESKVNTAGTGLDLAESLKSSLKSEASVDSTDSKQKIAREHREGSTSSSSTVQLDDWTQFLDSILQELHCPIAKYGVPSNDFSVLSCGCVASEQWARSRLPNLQLKVCPNCGNPTELKRPVVPLRNIYSIVMDKRKELGLPIPEEVGSEEEVEEEEPFVFQMGLQKTKLSRHRNSPRMPTFSRLKLDGNGNEIGENSIDSDSLNPISSTISGQSSTNEFGDRSSSDRNPASIVAGGAPPSPKMNLVSLFSTVARQTLNTPPTSAETASHKGSRSSRADDHDFSVASSSLTSHSSLLSPTSTQSFNHGFPSSSSAQSSLEPWSANARSYSAPIMLTREDEVREKHFSENFPIYRKDVRYSTQSNKGFSVIPRGRVFQATAISPDTRRFALVAEKRWEAFKIPSSYKLGSGPSLICVGKSSGEYGPSLDSCTKRDPDEKLRSLSWAQTLAAMSNRFLAIAGTQGVLRVLDLDKGGAPVYTDISQYPIRCIAISQESTLLACAVTSKDPVSGTELPVIILHNLSHLIGESTTKIKPVQIDMPYRDPLNTLSFSNDGKLLSCSTILESRFMVINLYDPGNPRLVIRSSRRLDTSFESEGITCMQFFPGNRLLAITSVANSAYPIIIDTKIPPIAAQSSPDPANMFHRAHSSVSGNSTMSSTGLPQTGSDEYNDDDYDSTNTMAVLNNSKVYANRRIPSQPVQQSSTGSGLLQPKMVTRFHEVGTAVHQVAISPRANAAAFLARNGTVFLTHFLRVEAEHRRVVAVVDVTNANKINEAASIAFSPNGQKLIIVDRKGILYIEDFGVGAENGDTLKKCRVIK